MSGSKPSWELFETFLTVMQEGSLSAAARSLRLSQPTVRRQIEALETGLGVTLFTRTTSGLVPTDAAAGAAPLAREMAASAAALIRTASEADGEGVGIVRIACSEVMASETLPAILRDLHGALPELEIELVPSDRDDDILRRDADIALRMHRPTQVGLIARKVADAELGLFADRSYFARRSMPISLVDLARGDHVLIGQDRQTSIASTLQAIDPTAPALPFRYRTDSDTAQLAAIRAGVGIGVCQARFGRQSGLRRVMPEVSAKLEIWLTMHEDLKDSRRLRYVFDHLAEAVESHYSD